MSDPVDRIGRAPGWRLTLGGFGRPSEGAEEIACRIYAPEGDETTPDAPSAFVVGACLLLQSSATALKAQYIKAVVDFYLTPEALLGGELCDPDEFAALGVTKEAVQMGDPAVMAALEYRVRLLHLDVSANMYGEFVVYAWIVDPGYRVWQVGDDCIEGWFPLAIVG